MALRQVPGDVGFGETPSPCVLVMLLGTRTPLVWLRVGADGGSVVPPPLSNLVHLIMRTGVLRFRFPPLMLFLRCWHFQPFFLIAEMEKQCEEGGESQNSRLPSSHSAVIVRVRDWDMSLRPTQSCGQPAQPRLWCPPRPGGVTFYVQTNWLFWCLLAVGLPHPPLLPPPQSSSIPFGVSPLCLGIVWQLSEIAKFCTSWKNLVYPQLWHKPPSLMTTW